MLQAPARVGALATFDLGKCDVQSAVRDSVDLEIGPGRNEGAAAVGVLNVEGSDAGRESGPLGPG